MTKPTAVKPIAYVTRILPQPALDRLAEATELRVWEEDRPIPRDRLLGAVAEADGLLSVLTERIDDELFDAAPRLRVVSNLAVGHDNVDLEAARRRGIPVGYTPGVLTETTADLAFTLLLAVARRVVEGVKYIERGEWKYWGPMVLLGRDVHHTTLGIIGLGRIGLAMARRARGFDMRVVYHSRTRRPDAEQMLGLEYLPLDDLMASADFVSLHVPLTPETRHLVGARELAQMRPEAILINTTRGPVIDQAALTEALRSGQIGGAGLDVTDPEPIDPAAPLLTLPNVTILPHVGSATIETRTKMALLAAENLLAGLRGDPLPHQVR